jgi:hypothetical protein
MSTKTHKERQEMHMKFYSGNLKNTLRRTRHNLKGNIKMNNTNWVEVEWTGFFFGLGQGQLLVLYD